MKRDLSPEHLEAMLDKARRKLASARASLTSGFYEDSSSRAYYAAFHAVSMALATKGLSFSSHGQTIGAFGREFVRAGLIDDTGFRRLQNLFAHRQTADYDTGVSIDQPTAAQDVEDAEWLVEACRALVEAGEAE